MQVFYKIAGGATGYVLLLDEAAGDSLEKESGSFKGLLQKEPLAFSASQFRTPRGNAVGTFDAKWISNYADNQTARAAVVTVNSLKLTAVHLKFVDGNSTTYIPNAIAEGYEYDRTGRSVTHTLNFEGDDLTTQEPI